MLYQQCKLEKKNEDEVGVSQRVLWAPEKFLQVGRKVKVEEDNGEWTEGWTVKEVYGSPLPEKFVKHMSHAHTRQRKASDI